MPPSARSEPVYMDQPRRKTAAFFMMEKRVCSHISGLYEGDSCRPWRIDSRFLFQGWLVARRTARNRWCVTFTSEVERVCHQRLAASCRIKCVTQEFLGSAAR